jgi:signal transduction histidine kinase
LGLYIARGIVERHGGHIDVESTVGRGTRFCFTIPMALDGGGA